MVARERMMTLHIQTNGETFLVDVNETTVTVVCDGTSITANITALAVQIQRALTPLIAYARGVEQALPPRTIDRARETVR